MAHKLKRNVPCNDALRNVFSDRWCSSNYWSMNPESFEIVMCAVMAVLYSADRHYETAAREGIVFW